MRLFVFMLLFILIACNEDKPRDDQQSAVDFRKKMEAREKKLGDDIEKLAKKQNEKNTDAKPKQQDPPPKQKVAKKQPVGKINLFEFLVLKAQASSKNSKLKRKDSLQKLAKIADGKQTKLFGIVKDVEEKATPNPNNQQKKITKYIVRFKSLFVGDKHFPFHLSFVYAPFVAETTDKAKVIEFGAGDFVSALGHLQLEMKKNSYNGQEYLDTRLILSNIVKGLDKAAMGLEQINSTVTTSDITSYIQMAEALKSLKKSFKISIYSESLKTLGIEADYIGDFKRENLNERYRREGNFRFVVTRDIKIFFKEDESLAKLLLRMPAKQDVQVRGKISKIKSDVALEKPSVLFELNDNKYQFSNGRLDAADGKLKTFDFYVYKNALLYKQKPISVDKFYLFLHTAKQMPSLVNLQMASKQRLNVFQAVITKLIEGSSIPYQQGSIGDQTTNADSSWVQIQELYQVATAFQSYRKGYPDELKNIAGRWSRNLRQDLLNDYIYINSSKNPFLDNSMQRQQAMIYPRKSLTKVVPVAFVNTGKNAFGYSVTTTKFVLLEKKQLREVENIAKGLVKSIDIDAVQKELKMIAKCCKVYQETLGRRVRYPKSLLALVENKIVKDTPQSRELLQNYEYIYSPVYTFQDSDKKRQQVLIYPKNIDFPQIPVAFIDYTDDKLSIVSKSKFAEIKKAALEARDRKN